MDILKYSAGAVQLYPVLVLNLVDLQVLNLVTYYSYGCTAVGSYNISFTRLVRVA